MENLFLRIESAEARVAALETKLLKAGEERECDGTRRVRADLFKRNVFTYRIVSVPSNYYEKSLEFRANLLSCKTSQLCKSIIFENTASDSFNIEDITNSRYYNVIVQYEARFDAEMLRDVIHSLRPLSDRLPKKKFNFRLAPEDVSVKLSGFEHNAVSPFGTVTHIPTVICKRCVEVNPSYIYLGGGHVDVKLGISIEDLLRSLQPIVALVSNPRSGVFSEEEE